MHAWNPKKLLDDIEELEEGRRGQKFRLYARSVKIWDSFPSINIRDERCNELSPDDRKVIRYRTQWIDEFKEIPFLAHSDKVEAQFLAAWERLAAVLEISGKFAILSGFVERDFHLVY